MNLQKWINEGRLQQHITSKKEIENLFELVDRDLKDAKIKQVSTDRRFTTAYNRPLSKLITAHIRDYFLNWFVPCLLGHV